MDDVSGSIYNQGGFMTWVIIEFAMVRIIQKEVI